MRSKKANAAKGRASANAYFLGASLGELQHGSFMILPLALHLYVPSFCFTHMDFEDAPKATVATTVSAARIIIRFMAGF
jgi:hypothetical protein